MYLCTLSGNKAVPGLDVVFKIKQLLAQMWYPRMNTGVTDINPDWNDFSLKSEMLSFEASKVRWQLGCWSGLRVEIQARNIKAEWFGATTGRTNISHGQLGRAAPGSSSEWVAEIQAEGSLQAKSCGIRRDPLERLHARKHNVCSSVRLLWWENSDSRPTWERWAGDRGVCLPHYLPVKTTSRFIFFSKWHDVVWGYLIFFKQTNKPKGTEGEYHNRRPKKPPDRCCAVATGVSPPFPSFGVRVLPPSTCRIPAPGQDTVGASSTPHVWTPGPVWRCLPRPRVWSVSMEGCLPPCSCHPTPRPSPWTLQCWGPIPAVLLDGSWLPP